MGSDLSFAGDCSCWTGSTRFRCKGWKTAPWARSKPHGKPFSMGRYDGFVDVTARRVQPHLSHLTYENLWIRYQISYFTLAWPCCPLHTATSLSLTLCGCPTETATIWDIFSGTHIAVHTAVDRWCQRKVHCACRETPCYAQLGQLQPHGDQDQQPPSCPHE